ncbi:BlaI/MecI/CopY family transcriptional regulator [Hyphococcus flavus]|uniref:BlaI/MecI/CopY family transcriptional regulator n=1 Tax=Hyphococcus flavus TaxID=1866326 RepID=A0AAF0CEG9_9PROT|nr:BlaI/MecI/CopY family transcriptional regulator [Hyphococcus flavus]WDI30149.1 BlaI/MecI/CopY family transcriptional regulator [Hyphococcus flavus]
MKQPQLLKLSKQGKLRILGELETEIMDIMWDGAPRRVKDVHEILSKKRDIAYTTVMTVMTNLYAKTLLTRKKQSRAYVYSARQKQQAFMGETFSKLIKSMLGDYSEPAMHHFIQELPDAQKKKLDKIGQIARKSLKKK